MNRRGQAEIATLKIVPEPTAAERDAIVAALVVLASRPSVASPAADRLPSSKWLGVARSEGLRRWPRDRGRR